MFNRILIANRGDSALRIIRGCRDLGIIATVIHSTADEDAMHVRLADEAICVGSAQSSKSYLNIPSILSAVEISGADAVHPGIGFLAENARFAELVNDMGLAFIGPSSDHINRMGDKAVAKEEAAKLGWPLVPGSDGVVKDMPALREIAKEIGYPLLLKAVAGGGGRGMKAVHHDDDLEEAFDLCCAEAEGAFGNGDLYVERLLLHPRHVEFQVLADGQGQCHVYTERDCSLQRRHQKVIEETPSPGIPNDLALKLMDEISQGLITMGYKGVGTLEFLYENEKFYFIEMNTRLQVEHTITEQLHGIDLVVEQIKVAAGIPLSGSSIERIEHMHAMEARIVAEDPDTNFPSPGLVTSYHAPGGPGIRVDSHIFSGCQVPPHYDSLIGKLISYGATRDEANRRMQRALKEYIISGIKTNIPVAQQLIDQPAFKEGNFDIHWLENHFKYKTSE